MIEVNLSIGFPAGSSLNETLAYGVRLTELVEQRYTSASVGDTGTGYGHDGALIRDLHFEVESTEEACELIGVLAPRLLDDGYTIRPERRDGLVRDENEMGEHRLMIEGIVKPGVARVGIIVFAADAQPV